MKKAMKQLHTYSYMSSALVNSQDTTLILPAVNRARRVQLNVVSDFEQDGLLLWISTSPHIVFAGTVATNGKLVQETGEDFTLGPNQPLYGITSGVHGKEDPECYATMIIEDSVDEGYYTDIGSGVEKPEPDRGSAEKKPQQAPEARSTRSAKKR